MVLFENRERMKSAVSHQIIRIRMSVDSRVGEFSVWIVTVAESVFSHMTSCHCNAERLGGRGQNES